MKKIICFIMIIVLCFCYTSSAYAEIYYSDIINHWSAIDVNYATNVLGVFNGYNDYTFRPDNEITRSEFIAILVRVAQKIGLVNEIYVSDMSYSDMNNKEWSYTYVISYYEYMKKNFDEYKFSDIFQGDYFYPDKPITREEAVLLIGALIKDCIYDNKLNFNDIDKTYRYYNQVKNLYNNGILTGYDDQTIKLNRNITRGESAALVKRVYENAKLLSNNYLSGIQFMPIPNEDVLPYFGEYNLSTTDIVDRMYIKAKNTLEYLAFGGYIFDEEKHLYDSDPIGTMKNLRDQSYYNKAGVDFYLLKYANLSAGIKTELANEILLDIVNRNDLEDFEIVQLIYLVRNYKINDTYYLNALSKWYSNTKNDTVLMNIKMLRYEHYIRKGNYVYVKSLIHDDISKKIGYETMLNINWAFKNNDSNNFMDLMNLEDKQLFFSIYPAELYTDEFNPYTKDIIILPHYTIVDDIIINSNFTMKNEEMFYKYSLNKAYILSSIGEYERAFIELYNDFKVIKNFAIYKTDRNIIRENINGVLMILKGKCR